MAKMLEDMMREARSDRGHSNFYWSMLPVELVRFAGLILEEACRFVLRMAGWVTKTTTEHFLSIFGIAHSGYLLKRG